MAEKRSPGFNIPLNFYDGSEVESIPRRIRAAAIGVWALAGDYAATQLTDGYVGPGVLKQLGCTDAIRDALKVTINKRGDLSPLWITSRHGGVQITNWAKHQRTNDEVTNYRASEAERKRSERLAKRNASNSDNGKASVRTLNGQPPDVQADAGDPKTETETETPTTASAVVARPRKRGSRLSADWIPSPELIAEMKAECPTVDLKAEHRKFVDHWTDKTGKDATKISWDGTWRNWIRRAAEQHTCRPTPNPSPGGHDTKVNAYLAYANTPHQPEIER